jgi:hypothetical protein
MSKLDSAQGNGCALERLEAAHGSAAAFYCTMILLDEIVEVLAAPHLNAPPLRILAPQISKSQMALPMAIERNLAGPPR